MNKNYTKPIVKSIKLDPKQAILHACKTGGLFLSTPTSSMCIYTGTSLPTTVTCNQTVKGGSTSIPTPTCSRDQTFAGS